VINSIKYEEHKIFLGWVVVILDWFDRFNLIEKIAYRQRLEESEGAALVPFHLFADVTNLRTLIWRHHPGTPSLDLFGWFIKMEVYVAYSSGVWEVQKHFTST
jgi:hypothetical protein